MPQKAKYLVEELSRRGPHPVLRGDLALVGLPGLVFTPEQGLGLPAVAFGHGWLQPPIRYRELLRHLASWGIVVAAPATQRGPPPKCSGEKCTYAPVVVRANVRIADSKQAARVHISSARTTNRSGAVPT